MIEHIAVKNAVVYDKLTFLCEICMIARKSYKSYMTLFDYRENWNFRTHRLGDSGGRYSFYWLGVIVVTIRVVFNYFNFLYEICLISWKYYKSYMTLHEIKESCMMGSPGIETDSSWNKIKSFLSSGWLPKPEMVRIFYMKTKEGKVLMVAVKLANIQASRISKNETSKPKILEINVL